MERDDKVRTGSSHTVSLLVENKPGVLHRMTIVVLLSSKTVEQVVRQVQKLVPVVEVRELNPVDLVERELLLVKIRTPEKNHAELRALAETYEAKIVDVSPDALIIEASGNAGKLDALEDRLAHYGIQELCRSGRIALERGFKTLAPPNLK